MSAVLTKYAGVKEIKRHANKLKKGYSMNSANDLEHIANLAYWLYIIADDIRMSLYICDILREQVFDGNYNKWTWLAGTYQLAAYLNDKVENEDEKAFFIKKLNLPLSFLKGERLDLYLVTIGRRANDKELYLDRIADAKKSGDKDLEINWRKVQIFSLIFIKMIGESRYYEQQQLEEMINANIAEIRAYQL